MSFLERAWYEKATWLIVLWPLAKLFQFLAALRRRYHQSTAQANPSPVPVVVVGNISVGGTGKAPLIIALGHAAKKAGLNPGIISRGYLGRAPEYPFSVEKDSPVEHVGDDAKRMSIGLLLAGYGPLESQVRKWVADEAVGSVYFPSRMSSANQPVPENGISPRSPTVQGVPLAC